MPCNLLARDFSLHWFAYKESTACRDSLTLEVLLGVGRKVQKTKGFPHISDSYYWPIYE